MQRSYISEIDWHVCGMVGYVVYPHECKSQICSYINMYHMIVPIYNLKLCSLQLLPTILRLIVINHSNINDRKTAIAPLQPVGGQSLWS